MSQLDGAERSLSVLTNRPWVGDDGGVRMIGSFALMGQDSTLTRDLDRFMPARHHQEAVDGHGFLTYR